MPGGPRPRTVIERMADKVAYEPMSGCWLWTGSVNNMGYGDVHRNGRTALAHRAVYEETVGPIPEGLAACHRCDTPACVNPQHIFLGSAEANARDKVSKGRQYRGERHWAHRNPAAVRRGSNHPGAALTEDQVREIRGLAGREESHTAIARRFRVSRQTVQRIVAGRRWRHVDVPTVQRLEA
jgi:hypothetical protein